MSLYALSSSMAPDPAPLIEQVRNAWAIHEAVRRSPAARHLMVLVTPGFAHALMSGMLVDFETIDAWAGMPCRIARPLPGGVPFAYVPRGS